MKIHSKVILAFIIIFFFTRNMLIPMAFDDYVYAFIWNGTFAQGLSSLKLVESLQDIFISQWTHYFTWGGRVISHFFVQFFIMVGKEYFNIVNTIMFVLLLWLINKIATGNNSFKSFNLIWIFFGLWICVAQLAFTTLWISGTCNYMWMTVLQLMFLLPYVNTLRNNFHSNDSKLWIIPLGLIAGWTNESGSLATIGITIIMLLFLYRQQRLTSWSIFGALALIVGCVLLIAAPGNMVRFHLNHPDFHWNLNILMTYLHGSFYEILSKNLILYIPIIYYFVRRERGPLSANDTLIIAFALGGLAVPTVMLASPEFFSHVGFTSTVFFIVASLAALDEIYNKRLYPKLKLLTLKISKYVCILFLGFCTYTMMMCLYSDFSTYKQIHEQMAMIEAHKDDDCIYVPPLKYSHRAEELLGNRIPAYLLKYIGGITPDTSHYYNEVFCKYYGLKKISTEN